MSVSSLGSRAIIGEYYMALAQKTMASWAPGVSMEFRSNQESETYKWLGQTPALREWIAGRQAKGLRDNGITIANRHYEATVDIRVEDIRRDKTGQIFLRTRELAGRSVQHWAKLLTTLIEGGSSTVCYDGQYFFDTDHSEGDSGTLKNYLTSTECPSLNVATAAAPTANEMADAIMEVISYMFTYKDDQGEPINEDAQQFLVMCPVGKIAASAKQAVMNQNLDTGAGTRDNPLRAQQWNLSVVGNPRLTWTTHFAVFRTDAEVKPLIRQVETEPTLDVIAEGSEQAIKEGKWTFGVDAWRNVGYGMWQLAAEAVLN